MKRKQNRTRIKNGSAAKPARATFKPGGFLNRALLALLCLALVGTGLFISPASSAQTEPVVNDPPANGHGIVVFPERDFVSAEGYDPALGAVTFSVIRNGVVISTAVAMPGDDGVAEVNHPG